MLYQLPLVAGFPQQALVLGEAAEVRESCEEALTQACVAELKRICAALACFNSVLPTCLLDDEQRVTSYHAKPPKGRRNPCTDSSRAWPAGSQIGGDLIAIGERERRLSA
ncbi:hypothetical protein D3C71_1865970 [compost metagenome]